MISIQDLAKKWLDLDQDEQTRNEIQQLATANDEAELELRLCKRIAFGTAGLRAAMKAGFAYMNSVTVLQASQGLAEYIRSTGIDGFAEHGTGKVVIGHDARHNSEKFARLAAAAFMAKGFGILWFERNVHTPMVPFAVKHYSAGAGIMITASHNPKNDNGYKVYWSNGCQIIPPHDLGIAAYIEQQDSILSWDTSAVDRSPRVKRIFDDAVEAYFTSIAGLGSASDKRQKGPRFLYTPMHGVGLPFMEKAVALLAPYHGSMHVVEQQAKPDPEFPTVPFPNPEEKGALDLAKAAANERGISLIVANDPDADRFAFAENVKGLGWKQLTGNQVGVLLASHVLETYSGQKDKLAMLASAVSSRMLAAMAERESFLFRETLTGFKWLGNVAQDLQREGYAAIYAYEEAIGYMFSPVVWDKDGIAAATMFLHALVHWQEQGLTPWSRLQQLYERFGFFEDANTYLISPSPEITNAVFTDIRKLENGSRPTRVGDHNINRWRDLTLGYDSASSDGKPDLPIDASAQMITCELENVVFTARGSGTEPKIKLYIEAKASTSQAATRTANDVLQSLLQEWFKPSYGLKLAGT